MNHRQRGGTGPIRLCTYDPIERAHLAPAEASPRPPDRSLQTRGTRQALTVPSGSHPPANPARATSLKHPPTHALSPADEFTRERFSMSNSTPSVCAGSSMSVLYVVVRVLTPPI